jgi:hypothetical protein
VGIPDAAQGDADAPDSAVFDPKLCLGDQSIRIHVHYLGVILCCSEHQLVVPDGLPSVVVNGDDLRQSS